MKNGRNYWAGHVEAIKSLGVSTSAYARQHGISVAALYYWQRKLQAQVVAHSVVLAAPKPQSNYFGAWVRPTPPKGPPPAPAACAASNTALPLKCRAAWRRRWC